MSPKVTLVTVGKAEAGHCRFKANENILRGDAFTLYNYLKKRL